LNLVGDHQRTEKSWTATSGKANGTLVMIRLFQRGVSRELERLTSIWPAAASERQKKDVQWDRDESDAYGCIERPRGCTAHALAARPATSTMLRWEACRVP